jgi:hypothetical protein
LNNLGWKLFNAFFPRILESFARCLATYLRILQKFTNEEQIKQIEEGVLETVRDLKKDKTYQPKSKIELFNLFLEQAIKSAGNETGKLSVDLTFGALTGGLPEIKKFYQLSKDILFD